MSHIISNFAMFNPNWSLETTNNFYYCRDLITRNTNGNTHRREDKDINQYTDIMEEKAIKLLEEYGLQKNDLTEAEFEALKKEIEITENNGMILDGVLSNPEIFYRNLRRQKTTLK